MPKPPQVPYQRKRVRVIDQERAAQEALAWRQAHPTVTLKMVSTEIGLSIAMISYLEHTQGKDGQKAWTEEHFQRYVKAVEVLGNGK